MTFLQSMSDARWCTPSAVCPAFGFFVISAGNEISFETLSAISSFQIELRHVHCLQWLAGGYAKAHHGLACVDSMSPKTQGHALGRRGEGKGVSLPPSTQPIFPIVISKLYFHLTLYKFEFIKVRALKRLWCDSTALSHMAPDKRNLDLNSHIDTLTCLKSFFITSL